jgi:short-subunit dehydrogenase
MNRRAIITGASSGIGKEAAILLAQAGCEVVLASRRAPELEVVLAQCGPSARAMVCDIGTAEACHRLIEVARSMGDETYPVLVNAAGMAAFGGFLERPIEEFEEQVRVNLLGAAYCSHAIIPWMLQQGGGQIINVLSVAAVHVFPGSAGYSSSKAALHVLGKVISEEFRSQGVRVTSLLPGSVDTPLWEGKEWSPPREDMLSATAVAEAIRDLVMMPTDRNVDELRLMPPKGIL